MHVFDGKTLNFHFWNSLFSGIAGYCSTSHIFCAETEDKILVSVSVSVLVRNLTADAHLAPPLYDPFASA